jgi:excisionase family DNA binding protein
MQTQISPPLLSLSTGRLLTRHQAAELLNVSESTIWRLIKSGDLAARRVGHQLRVAEVDAEDYLRRSEVTST